MNIFQRNAKKLVIIATISGAASVVFIRLIEAAGGNVNLAEKGIIVIDEIDKLVTGANNLKGKSFQHSLLKILEGATFNVNINDLVIPFCIKNVLFVACGTFVELSKMIRERIASTASVMMTEDELIKQAGTDDFAEFGFIPEFMGRLPIRISLSTLDKDELRRVLTEPVNSITSQYKKMLAMDGVKIVFAPDALAEIAGQATKLKTGARGLRTVLEKAMTDIIFDAQKNTGKKVTVTRGVIQGTEKASYENVE